MIFLTNKRFDSLLRRIEALENAKKPTKPMAIDGHGGGLYMYEAIHKVMADGKPKNSRQIAKEINSLGLTNRRAKAPNICVRLAEYTRKGKLRRVSAGVYQSVRGAI